MAGFQTYLHSSALKCPICLDVLENPFRLVPCSHVFCKDCISGFLPEPKKEKQTNCPICRAIIETGVLDTSSVEQLEKQNLTCEGCKQSFATSAFSGHQDNCRAFLDLDNERRKKLAELKPLEKEEKSKVNRSTFACPFGVCTVRNLDGDALVDHVNKVHSTDQNKSGVCPVCVSMPWGDPTYICNNLIAHINQRHKFDYNQFVNYSENDEDAVLQAVLAASLNEN